MLFADDTMAGDGKILATPGVAQAEGSGGGGRTAGFGNAGHGWAGISSGGRRNY